MEILYRVQDECGEGPYASTYSDLCTDLCDAHSGDDTHPTPASGGYWMVRGKEKCAFRSMQDLFRWFGGWLPLLLREGYKVVRVRGIVNYADDYQVVYKEAL